MARRWPNLVVVHCGVLVGKLAATCDSLVEEIYARTHAVCRHALGETRVDLRLHLPGLTVAILWINVV